MTVAHRIEAVLTEDGKLTLNQLPFRAGETVEIIVLSVPTPVPPTCSLKGTVVRYERPTDPVALEDWSALQ